MDSSEKLFIVRRGIKSSLKKRQTRDDRGRYSVQKRYGSQNSFSPKLTKALVCQTCGDKGFTNAFVYCVKCLDFVIHRYCLKVMPRTFDEFVIWYCEQCKETVGNQVTSPKVKSSRSQKEEAASSGQIKATHHKKRQKKEKNIASLTAGTMAVNCQEKTPESERECILPTDSSKEASMKSNSRHEHVTCVVAGTEEDISSKAEHVHRSPKKDHPKRKKIGAHLGAKKKELKLRNGLKAKTQKACTMMADSMNHSRNSIHDAASNLKNEEGVVYSLEEQRDESQLSQLPCERKKLISDSPSSMETESVKLKDESQLSQPPCERKKLISDSPSSMETELVKLKATQDSGTNVSQSADSKNDVQKYYIHSQPVIDPVWRGSFSILHTDYDQFEGFVAHFSNKACDKVCQEANMLPSLLHLEMHPKTVLWPKSFQECEPSDNNIALYFFPGDPIHERDFDHLVIDMINGDLAMRAMAKNAELLVFTSRVLPQLFWRFKGKYYLWGVFRGKRNISTSVASNGISKDSPNEAINVERIPKRMKTLDARSPRSPLSSSGESVADMDPECGD